MQVFWNADFRLKDETQTSMHLINIHNKKLIKETASSVSLKILISEQFKQNWTALPHRTTVVAFIITVIVLIIIMVINKELPSDSQQNAATYSST